MAAPASQGDGVLSILRKPRATIVFTVVHKSFRLIRAQASMADLLGLPADLRYATDDQADLDHIQSLAAYRTVSGHGRLIIVIEAGSGVPKRTANVT